MVMSALSVEHEPHRAYKEQCGYSLEGKTPFVLRRAYRTYIKVEIFEENHICVLGCMKHE